MYLDTSTLRPNPDLLRKCNSWPLGWESNPRPRESSAMLCQLARFVAERPKVAFFATGPGWVLKSRYLETQNFPSSELLTYN